MCSIKSFTTKIAKGTKSAMKQFPTPYQSYTHERNYGCRVSEWTLHGWKAIVLENNLLRITVLPDKGTDIYEFLYKPLDLDVMFRTPIGLRERSRIIPPMQLPSGQMMDYFFGGWFEMFPNAGYTFDHQGFPWGLHGEVSLQAWDAQVIEDTPQSVAVKFSLRTFRTLFRLEKIIRLVYDSPAVFFEESITNEAAQPMDTSWGHHLQYSSGTADQLSQHPARTACAGECAAFRPRRDGEHALSRSDLYRAGRCVRGN